MPKKHTSGKMKVITLQIERKDVEKIDLIIAQGWYTCRSEFVRNAINLVLFCDAKIPFPIFLDGNAVASITKIKTLKNKPKGTPIKKMKIKIDYVIVSCALNYKYIELTNQLITRGVMRGRSDLARIAVQRLLMIYDHNYPFLDSISNNAPTENLPTQNYENCINFLRAYEINDFGIAKILKLQPKTVREILNES